MYVCWNFLCLRFNKWQLPVIIAQCIASVLTTKWCSCAMSCWESVQTIRNHLTPLCPSLKFWTCCGQGSSTKKISRITTIIAMRKGFLTKKCVSFSFLPQTYWYLFSIIASVVPFLMSIMIMIEPLDLGCKRWLLNESQDLICYPSRFLQLRGNGPNNNILEQNWLSYIYS